MGLKQAYSLTINQGCSNFEAMKASNYLKEQQHKKQESSSIKSRSAGRKLCQLCFVCLVQGTPPSTVHRMFPLRTLVCWCCLST
jgi:hypothetical protein